MEFKCSIEDSRQIKTFSKALNTICLIGDNEVMLQINSTSLVLTTFDNSLSACANISFTSQFFTRFEFRRGSSRDGGGGTGEQSCICRVATKILLIPFRSSKFTKFVTCIQLNYSEGSDPLSLIISTKFEASFHYALRLSSPQQESLQLDYDRSSLPSTLTAEPKLIIGSLSNFTNAKGGVGDLTLEVSRHTIVFKNSFNNLVHSDGRVHTAIRLDPVDFASYTVTEDSDFSFSLREFKVFASFAEFMKLPLTLKFKRQSEPVAVFIETVEKSFEAALTLISKPSNNVEVQAENIVSQVTNPISLDCTKEKRKKKKSKTPPRGSNKKRSKMTTNEPELNVNLDNNLSLLVTDEGERGPLTPMGRNRAPLFTHVKKTLSVYDLPGVKSILVEDSDPEN